jgi:mRNA interferase RelE/StbE
MRSIAYTSDSIRALGRMPGNAAKRIRGKIAQLAKDPESLASNVKRLRGRPGFRLRVGTWRVIFDQDTETLTVLDIGPRGSIYED